MVDDELAPLLAEQLAYYRALAPEYYDGGLDFPAATNDLKAGLDAFAPGGDVLELACGPGTWTPRLLRYAASVTAVDASPEMLALARKRVGDEDRVRFVCADLFAWRPGTALRGRLLRVLAFACSPRALRRVLGARR